MLIFGTQVEQLYIPLFKTYVCGFLENCAALTSEIHVPSKGLWAKAVAEKKINVSIIFFMQVVPFSAGGIRPQDGFADTALSPSAEANGFYTRLAGRWGDDLCWPGTGHP
jgi:hypothetical protein